MAAYFFHLHDRECATLDEEGREMADLPAVTAAALFDARSIISSDAHLGILDLDQRLDVSNASGAVIHSLQFVDAFELTLPR